MRCHVKQNNGVAFSSDQNGTTHTYTYDVLARLTADTVSTLGSGVNGAVRRLGYTFDTADRPYQQTSYADTGGTIILNQVEDAYNNFGQLTDEYQDHTGAVPANPNPSTTPAVQYAYTSGTNFSRLTSITDPNGRVITYNYNTGIDSTISRLSSMSDGSTTLESYTYLGLDTIVQKSHPEDGVNLTYIQQTGDTLHGTDGGDRYTGLDRFGRVADQFWYNPTTSTTTDRFQLGYDRDSNVLFKNNLVNGNFSELYHANGTSFGYDSLNRLTNFARGTLNSTNDTISSPSTTNSWTLDAVGNSTNTGGSSRTVNAQNEITSFSGHTTPLYDYNGNMTKDEFSNTYTFDAWNRLIAVNTNTEIFSYDADNRRPGLSLCGLILTNSYYSSQWQDLEDDSTQGVNTTKDTYVWSQSYIDDLVARDQSVNGGAATRIYVQQDANHDVTALVNTSGAVLQRFIYDPYGKATVLTPSWATTSDAYSWVYTFQGGRSDANSGKINFRHRDLDTIGVWMERDPDGYINGGNLYQAFGDNPVGLVDPMGSEDVHTTYIRAGGATSRPTTQAGGYTLPAPLGALGANPGGAIGNGDYRKIYDKIDGSPGSVWVVKWGGNNQADLGDTESYRTTLSPAIKDKPCLILATLVGEMQHVINYWKARDAIHGTDSNRNLPFDEREKLEKYLKSVRDYTELDAHNAAIDALQHAIADGRLGKCPCGEPLQDLKDQLNEWIAARDKLKKKIGDTPRPEPQ